MPKKPRGKPTISLPKAKPISKEISPGTEIFYVVCPLCARNRILEVTSDKAKNKGKGRLRWDFWNGDSPIIQIRVGGGKKPKELQPELKIEDFSGFKKKRYSGIAQGSGFHLKEKLSWQEAKADNRFKDQIDAIKKQIEKIYSLLCQ